MKNNDYTITICDMKFDIPNKEHISKKWNYNVEKDGKTTIRNCWLDSYVEIGTEKSIESHLISITNRGRVMFDGKDIRNKDDIENIKWVFSNI